MKGPAPTRPWSSNRDSGYSPAACPWALGAPAGQYSPMSPLSGQLEVEVGWGLGFTASVFAGGLWEGTARRRGELEASVHGTFSSSQKLCQALRSFKGCRGFRAQTLALHVANPSSIPCSPRGAQNRE